MPIQQSKILITGATGLVGKEIVKILLQNNYVVHYLTSSKSKIESKENYKGFYWNIKNKEIDTNAFQGVTTIIHLAGASISKRWTKSYKQEILNSRVLSSELLFKTLQNSNHEVKHLISASAIGIYPNSLAAIYTENSNVADASFLGEVVQKWENSVVTFEKLNIEVAKIRIGLVLSNKGGALPEMIKPIQLNIGSPFGSGKQFQSWIHIEDLVAIFLFVLKNNLKGTFNAVAPNAVSNEVLTKKIANQLGKRIFLPNVPQFTMKLLLGEMSYLLFSSQNVSSQKLQNQGFQFNYKEIDEALNNLL